LLILPVYRLIASIRAIKSSIKPSIKTWKFNFDDSHQDGVYYYFTKCPIAKFFKDNNLEEITPIFCELDHLMIKTRKAKFKQAIIDIKKIKTSREKVFLCFFRHKTIDKML